MLTITPEASEAIRGILDTEEVPDGSVVRISSSPGTGLAISVAESAEPEDQVVEGKEVEVCLEPTAAQLLDDKELDATVAEGKVNFRIGEQGSEPA